MWRVAAIAVVLGGAALAVVGLSSREPALRPPAPSAGPARQPAQYVGQARCAGCHRDEADAWRGSQHAQAMQPPTASTVLGDFGDAGFTHDGVTSTFFRKGEKYFVRTDGPDGRLADFEVAYTFGVYPLQQYLIPFPDGRMQALSIAWDARSREAGGQRWFHLYPDERVDHHDELHWTRLQQNWNYVCADCHSTNLRRNYDPATDRYATTWSDLNVACEACHGPGSDHVAWAEKRPGAEGVTGHGLAIALDERRGVGWIPDAAGNARRGRPLASHREVETCAVCHARRRPLGTDPGPTGRLLDTHAPTLLEEGFYQADGQQQAEVYTYGSFVQSKMYAKGVTCSDCHDPHTQKLRAPGNAVCSQCHAPAVYETSSHLMHPTGAPAAQCVACHMPARTYMLIDPRHDHSMRVPRPDLTVRYGVPNACAACHGDRDAAWAAAAIEQRHGPTRKGFQTFVEALAAGRSGAPGAAQKLDALVRDPGAPAIARATALRAFASFPGPTMLSALRTSIADDDAMIRAAAVEALLSVPPDTRAPLAAPLADDPVKDVRVQAGRTLAAVPPDGLSPEQRARRDRAIAAYVASEAAMAERPESHLNLGTVRAELGDAAQAEAQYRTAIRLQADFVPAYANLADLYRALGREADATTALDDGLKAAPGDPSLLHALGLARVRAKRLDDALPLLARASAARPENARFAYVYAVGLRSVGRAGEAMTVLTTALERSPYDRDLLIALATFNRDAGRRDAAREYAARLAGVAPDDDGARALVRSLSTE
jgi:Tfp pilus assembly protein PilF